MEKAISRQLSTEKSFNLEDRTTIRPGDKTAEATHNVSSTKRRERSRRESILEEESSVTEAGSKLENTPSSRVSNRPSQSTH